MHTVQKKTFCAATTLQFEKLSNPDSAEMTSAMMNGSMDIVRVSKRTLRFPVATAAPSDNLVVYNPTDLSIAFKVKTTNQTRYIVRPNVGVIPPGDSTTILIAVQSNEPLQPGCSRDKFLLKATSAPGVVDLPSDFWGAREDDPSVVGIKFKVEFLAEGDDLVTVDETLLEDGNYEQAVAKVKELQDLLESKNLELAKLRTELAETKAETERVLKEAPQTPLAANKILSDPFGGVSIAGFGLMLLLFLVLVNVILRLF